MLGILLLPMENDLTGRDICEQRDVLSLGNIISNRSQLSTAISTRIMTLAASNPFHMIMIIF